jgi:hypothetical protein
VKKTWTKNLRPVIVVGEEAFVTLSDGSIAVVDAVDVPIVGDWLWSATKKGKSGKVYAHRGTGRKTIKLHNEILPPLPGGITDHRDGDPLNCRRSNLRRASNRQNTQNRRIGSANTSGFKGVCFRRDRGTWLAAITHEGRLRKIGTFPTAEAAAAARDEQALLLHGEFAVLNFPREAA